jgi:hypothetical protein
MKNNSEKFMEQKGVLTVDYSKSLEQMIENGKYDWVNEDVTPDRFIIKGNGQFEFEAAIFHFDQDISSENAKKEIEKAGYEVAKIEHILSFRTSFPKEHWPYRIVGLGSYGEIKGDSRVPELRMHNSDRALDLIWPGADWDTSFAFLAVRKKA